MSERAAKRWSDPVIEAFKRDVDRTLLRENLKRSLEERFHALKEMQRLSHEMRQAMREARRRP